MGPARRRARDPARGREGHAAPRRRCCSASASCSARSCSTPRRRSTRYARAFREDPSTEAAKDQLEALAPLIEDGWARLVKLFEGALEQQGPRSEARPRARDEGRAQLRGPPRQQREGRRVLQEGARDRARRPRRARRARGDLHARREVPASCSRSIAVASTSRTSPTSASSSCSASASIHEEMLERARRGDRDLQRDPRPGAGRPEGAARPRSAVRAARRRGATSATTSAASSRSSSSRTSRSRCWFASRSCARRTSTRSRAAVETYRQVLDHEDQNRDAVDGARALDRATPSTSSRSRTSSSRSTRRAASGRSRSASTRSWRSTPSIPRARSSCST